MTKNLTSFIKSFDLFGESFTFKIRKRKYYTSVVGGITSLAFLIYCIYFLFYTLGDFFAKYNRSIENGIKSVSEPTINFDDHKYFKMAFCLRDNSLAIDQYLIKNSDLRGYSINNKLNGKRLNSEKTNINIKDCSKDFFDGPFSDIYEKQDFDGCRCINTTSLLQDSKLSTMNNAADRDYLQFSYEIKKDVNFTNFNNYLQKSQSKLFVYFPSYSIDLPNALQDPVKLNVHTEMYDLKSYTSHNPQIFLNILNFTDYNSLYDDQTKIQVSRLSFENSNRVSYFMPNLEDLLNETFIKLDINISLKSITYTRKVLRYDDFLGNLVGYLSNIIIILYFFNALYNSFGSRVYFAEKFFLRNKNAELQIWEELNKKLNSLNEKSYQSDNQENFSNNISNEKKYDPNNPNMMEKELPDINVNFRINEQLKPDGNKLVNTSKKLLEKRNNFKFNFLEYFIYSCFCCSCSKTKSDKLELKSSLLESSDNFFDYFLDVNTYVKKMIEIDIIKLIILNDNNDLEFIDKFKPVLKSDYSEEYYEKIEKLYKNKFNIPEHDELLSNIKEMKYNDKKLYKKLLSFY